MENKLTKKWYAIYTKPRWEKKIDSVLIRKGIESWCPLQKVERQWSDRKKIIEELKTGGFISEEKAIVL